MQIEFLLIAAIGSVVTAVAGLVGEYIRQWRRRHRKGADQNEIDIDIVAQRASDAVSLIESEITDLQNRVGRIEVLLLKLMHSKEAPEQHR
jgi:hypothetical protein